MTPKSINPIGTHKPNRLLKEKSPYLLQHAYNPVDWFPWGEEAFEQAQILNRPIFLSIGYSSCHWCHVMEKESFENPEIAEILNRRFVSIKVDREERPDIDSIYIRAIQMITGQGGWPLSVFLTPSLKPFFGGTYYPPEDIQGMPGFKTVLRTIAQRWGQNNGQIIESAEHLLAALRESLHQNAVDSSALPRYDNVAAQALQELTDQFDPINAGFGAAPKFPMPTYLHFLLHHYFFSGDRIALNMAEATLQKMIAGGIYDQLGGGFARYSTDARWVVPHFEKMLYDNAQLLSVLTALFQITRNPLFEGVIRETVDYVKNNLTHHSGGFFSAEDADSSGKEGAHYLWTIEEIRGILKGFEAEVFIRRFGVTLQGNFFNHDAGAKGTNVLYRAESIESLSKLFNKPETEIEKILSLAKKKMMKARLGRPRPAKDDKILTSWNGLMISALAKASGALNDGKMLAMASNAARFIREVSFDPAKKTLYRRWRDGERKILAYLDDFAFLTAGLIDLFMVSGESEWLEWAINLHEMQNSLFIDGEGGGYFVALPYPDLLVRMKDEQDGVIPAGNSLAALNGLRLGRLTEREDFMGCARKTLGAYARMLARAPSAFTTMLTALQLEAKGETQVVLLGDPQENDVKNMREAVFDRFLGSPLIISSAPGEPQKKLATIIPFIENMRQLNNRATAFVCRNFTCDKPTDDVTELIEKLKRED